MINTSILSKKNTNKNQPPRNGSLESYNRKQNIVLDYISSENWTKFRNALKKPSLFRRFSVYKYSKTDPKFLFLACEYSPPLDVIKALIKLNPQATHEMDSKGRYALHVACEYGCEYEIIKILIQANPDAVKKIDKDCRSPYLLACRSYVKNSKYSSATKDLLKVLYDFDDIDEKMHELEDKDGMTPLEYAVEQQLSIRIVTYLQQIIEDRRIDTQRDYEVVSQSKRDQLNLTQLCMHKKYVLPKEYSDGINDSSEPSLLPKNQTMRIAI